MGSDRQGEGTPEVGAVAGTLQQDLRGSFSHNSRSPVIGHRFAAHRSLIIDHWSSIIDHRSGGGRSVISPTFSTPPSFSSSITLTNS